MEAIRQIQTVEEGQIHIHLPQQFWEQQVEIIVLSNTTSQQKTHSLQKKSLRGCLHDYANPTLITQEKEAWKNAIKEKHGHC